MRNVKLNGYREVIANNIFAKKDVSFLPNGEAGVELILLARYTLPMPDEVLEFIASQAQEYSMNPKSESISQVMANTISTLSAAKLEKLVKKDLETYGHIRRHFDVGQALPGREYFHSIIGVSADDSLMQTIETYKQGFIPDLSQFLGALRIRHSLDGGLPSGEIFNYLVEERVKDESLIYISDNSPDLKIANKWRMLVSAFDNPKKVSSVNDFSESIKRNISLCALQSATSCEQRRMANLPAQKNINPHQN